MRIRLPNNGWRPRLYQRKAWNYVVNGGKHAELIWHRRSGKDELALHSTAIRAMERPATYWHMLPKKDQVRKAIWEAVNPHTGIRRVDEAFPKQLRSSTRENEMMIKFVNGSTWQALGSDNFEGAIGSPPAGIVYSEWPQAKPAARAYLRPILAENGGWQLFIGTPRGKNHGYKTFQQALQNPDAFAQLLTAEDTGVLTKEQLAYELEQYIGDYGEDMGQALYYQEYMCSFEAAVLGAFYVKEAATLEREGRFCHVGHDPDFPVHVTTDIGRTDDNAIWWYQVIAGEVRVLECTSESGKDPDWFASQLLGVEVKINIINGDLVVEMGVSIAGLGHRQAYRYETINLPHDAFAKTYSAKGKAVSEQLIRVFPGKIKRVPSLSFQDGIQATRNMFPRVIMSTRCEEGWEALKSYRREWNADRKRFSDNHVHDWSSNYADAFRYMGICWKERVIVVEEEQPIKGIESLTINELWKANKPARKRI